MKNKEQYINHLLESWDFAQKTTEDFGNSIDTSEKEES